VADKMNIKTQILFSNIKIEKESPILFETAFELKAI